MNEPFNTELEYEKTNSIEIPDSLDQNIGELEVLDSPDAPESENSAEKPKKKRKFGHFNFHFSRKFAKKMMQSIAFKFAVVLFIFLALSFSTLSFFLVRSIAKDNTETYTHFSTTIAERTADGLTYWLDSFFKNFGIFTNSNAFISGDYELACQYLTENKALIDPSFDFMGIAGQDGLMYDSNGNFTDISHEDFFTAIYTNGKQQYISDPVPSPDGIGYIFYISAPVTNSNKSFWGVVVGALALSKVNYQITQSSFSENSFTYAIDSKGNIIAHPEAEKIMQNFYAMGDEQSGFEGYTALTQSMLLNQKGSSMVKDNGKNAVFYVFYCPINHTNWSLAIAINQIEITSIAKKSAFQICFISIIIAVVLLIVTSIYLTLLVHPLVRLKNSIIEIASGDADLTKRIEVKSKDEVGEVVLGFNTFTENLRHIIMRIKESKDDLARIDGDMASTTKETGSSINKIISHISTVSGQIDLQGQSVEETADQVNQIAKNIDSLNALIENQSSGVTQASAAVEQMLGNITSVTRSTEHMVESFDALETDTTTGIAKQNTVDEQIQQIQEQSQMLMEANKVISKIASETNLLAMNASIEAAHAGDAGQGFSVVADEIHNLSESSSRQSKRIRDELQKIQDSIEKVVLSSAEAKNSFQSVTQKIRETDQLVQQIKGAMEESEIGSRQITEALKMMNDSTSDVRVSSGNMSAGNQGILNQVKKLQMATEEIKMSMSEMTSSANQISSNGKTLGDISETMQISIAKIGSQIDLFSV